VAGHVELELQQVVVGQRVEAAGAQGFVETLACLGQPPHLGQRHAQVDQCRRVAGLALHTRFVLCQRHRLGGTGCVQQPGCQRGCQQPAHAVRLEFGHA
jgi:hypothetical protein